MTPIISTDKVKLDLEMIHEFLSEESYWAKGRTKEAVLKSIENSICFGIYEGEKQIAFARVVTDYVVFAWVMDVFVVPEARGNGIGKLLMEQVTHHADLIAVQGWGLKTFDAHSLYEKQGFTKIECPIIFMEKK